MELNGYDLSRTWFDFCFANPELISPNHSALYFFCIEHCNRLGWKEKFGLPSEMAKEAIGIKNYRTYKNTIADLEAWGFIRMVQESKNQYSSCIIALVKNTKAPTKALDKALQKHSTKQGESIVSIDKPINNKQINLKTTDLIFPFSSDLFISVWSQLVSEPKWRKKTATALQASLKQLSLYPENIAVSMMEKTIAGGYQGLFEIKNPIKNEQQQVSNPVKLGRIGEDEFREFIRPRNNAEFDPK